MKPTMSCFIFLLFLLVIATTNISFCNASSYMGCIKGERQALLKFKQDLSDPSNLLASWTADGDCCKWVGIRCDNSTGHVLELRLRSSYVFIDGFLVAYLAYNSSMLGGKINPSLLDLKHLTYLDLSGNDFEGIQIPAFLGSIRNLRYLNLSYTGLVGMIPHQFGNLSSLQYLDLNQEPSYMSLVYADNFDFDMLFVDNFRWLSDLRLLKHLDLGGVNLSKTFDQWLFVSNVLPSLAVLKLPKCGLHHMPPVLIANFSSLTTLDLSNNQLFNYSPVPSWVFSLSQLDFLNLCGNNIQGPIPNEIQNLTSLIYLDLSANNFNLSILDSLYKLSHLENLFLQNNDLQGKLLDGLGNLTSISVLDLSSNKLEGKIPISFAKLCSLKLIIFADIKLSQDIFEVLDILSECISNGLELLILSGNQLYGHLTNQLGQFKNLVAFGVNINLISGHVPTSLGELSSLQYLALSYNQLSGSLSETHFVNLTSLIEFAASKNSLTLEFSPNWTPPFQLRYFKMTSCLLGPQFPSWILSQKKLIFLDLSSTGIVHAIPNKIWKSSFQVLHLNLSHNQIHGKLPNLIKTNALESLDLSSNNLSGPLPSISSNLRLLHLSNNAFSGTILKFLCYRINETKSMQFLHLENNLLYGELPECFKYWTKLKILNLSKNNFFGKLPTSMGTLNHLQSLNLRRNNLFGTLPMSLQNCLEIVSLDLGENDFTGNVPSWMGEKLLNTMVLIFRSNKFHGPLPVELCHLAHLQILDLAYNNLSGTIPRCIGNLSAMVTVAYSEVTYVKYNVSSSIDVLKQVEETVILVMKGKVAEYNTILKLVKSMDLSENNFSGKIPIEITNLGALVSLNLSHNSLSGKIPEKIGVMRYLECIDFSKNQLSGEIPQSISNLTFLSILNLSNNNLVGKIPSSTQLQSFNVSSFTGNELCGLPLPENCTETGTTSISDHESGDEKDGSENEMIWFFVSMALGFVVGFWSVIGPLLVNRRRRYMYCRFLDGLGGKFASVVNKCC